MLDTGAQHGAAEGAGGRREDRQPGGKGKGAHDPTPAPFPTWPCPARPTPKSGTPETQMTSLTMETLTMVIVNNGASYGVAADDRITDDGCH